MIVGFSDASTSCKLVAWYIFYHIGWLMLRIQQVSYVQATVLVDTEQGESVSKIIYE